MVVDWGGCSSFPVLVPLTWWLLFRMRITCRNQGVRTNHTLREREMMTTTSTAATIIIYCVPLPPGSYRYQAVVWRDQWNIIIIRIRKHLQITHGQGGSCCCSCTGRYSALFSVDRFISRKYRKTHTLVSRTRNSFYAPQEAMEQQLLGFFCCFFVSA